jgi:hypothetical protein
MGALLLISNIDADTLPVIFADFQQLSLTVLNALKALVVPSCTDDAVMV